MLNFINHFGKFLPSQSLSYSLAFLLSLGVNLSLSPIVQAKKPQTAPSELTEVLKQIQMAANQGDVKKILTFYSPDFTNTDGLKIDSLAQSLEKMRKRFPNLTYSTELQSWEQRGNELIAETVTYIRGYQRNQGRLIFLNSTITSRQYLVNQKIVRQEILSEKTRLTTGIKPPQVDISLPDKLTVNEQFNFDIIVKEPLGDDLLLGGVIEEEIAPNLYLNPSTFKLELLTAGGIFKIGKAPETPGHHWFSAILVRSDGITLVTQRVTVESNN